MLEDKKEMRDGFHKIVKSCNLASSQGISYVWIDTCCIDKSSNAELGEAINSMYRYYKESKVCYAYLADVDSSQGSFAHSRWFTRGWTLQELIAPDRVEFYGNNWRYLGNKINLREDIIAASGIPESALYHTKSLDSFPVAQRLSWAAKRRTTRTEDAAYCLIGLLGIEMGLLYGEGSLAFKRLWETILQSREDYSIFLYTGLVNRFKTWESPPSINETQEYPLNSRHTPRRTIENWDGLEQHSPIDVISARSFAEYLPPIEREPLAPQPTGRGLRLNLYAKSVRKELIAWIYCTQERRGKTYALCTRIIPSAVESNTPRHYIRGVISGEVYYVAIDRLRGFELKDIYISLKPREDPAMRGGHNLSDHYIDYA